MDRPGAGRGRGLGHRRPASQPSGRRDAGPGGLRWHLQRGNIVFPKPTTPDRIKENIDIFDFGLSANEVEAISALNRNERTGLAVLALVPRLVPPDVPGRGSSGRRLDLAGLAIAVPAVFLVVLPLMLGHQENWPSWVLGCIALGLLLGVGFVGVERRIANRGGDPLLNLAVLRAPGLVPGLVAVAVLMITYGGFLFSFALHLQAGLGDSALRAGLTFAPCALVFGACGYFWRRLPAASHHLLAPLGCLVAVGGYLAVAVVLRSGGQGGIERDTVAPAVSGQALAITLGWLSATLVLAVVASIRLARTAAAARRSAG